MMVRRIAEENHSVFVLVRKFKTHDLGPELGAALDVADAQNNVTDLFYFNGCSLFCHKSSVWLG
jgi:hypothetical protein